LYADTKTESIRKAMAETDRRREIQSQYNKDHNITPATIRKKIKEGLGDLFDGVIRLGADAAVETKYQKLIAKFHTSPNSVQQEVEKLREKMRKHSQNLEFEEAAKIRDEIKRLQILELSLREAKSE
jgi:excinuclease ABC subunit B